MEIAIAVAVLGGLILGILCGYLGLKIINVRRTAGANAGAERIIEDAKEERRAIIIEAKEEAIRLRSTGEEEIRDRRAEVQNSERRLRNREENVERRSNNMDRRERNLVVKEQGITRSQSEVDDLKQKHVERLESVAGLSGEAAQEMVMRRAEDENRHELARQYRDMEVVAKSEASEKAQSILGEAIQRLAADVVTEATVTTVDLPNDDMKGRLIGREGRNIRAIEKSTGVDLIIDDTPEAVTLSCFDPIRRETARIAVSKLVTDGRIHPARIEDMVHRAQQEVDNTIWKSGEQAMLDAGVRGLNPDLIKLVGRLKYRYSYGQHVLQHSLEVSHLAGMLAAEVGADVKIAKAGGLLHDVGKALTHEVEGPHAEIGADIASRYNVGVRVRTCIAEHHDDYMTSVESFVVAAADAISAARPGSRKDTVENYIKRLEALEEVAGNFDGVEKCFAIQAGREVRVMVKPDTIDDVGASSMARDIVRKIEESLVYPGQIKVIVIRESRSVEYAR